MRYITEVEKQIASAKRKLSKIYKIIPEDKKDIASDLINNIAFMQVQLEILRKQILEHGMVSVYDNGKIQQDIVSPYCKAYNQLNPKYLQSIVTLNKLLPPNEPPPQADDLSRFIQNGSSGW